jgi:hypothetical protein
MSGLGALQQSLRRAVACGVAVEGLLAPGAGHLAARLEIYRAAYRARLVEALRANYPVLHRVLGDDGFDALARAYIEARPSHRPSIRWFGDDLYSVVMDREALLPHPALADLIRMEWALGVAFDAEDGPVLGADALSAFAPEVWPGLCLRLHPSACLLRLDWRVEPVWQALSAAAGDADVDGPAPEQGRHALLVWRQGLAPHFRSLTETEAACLERLMDGGAFTDICAEVCSGDDVADAARVVGMVRRWLDEQLISAVSVLRK